VSARCAAAAGAADPQAEPTNPLRCARAWRGRVIEFRRAPMLASRGEVQAWLASQGYGAGVQIFRGPDGSWRGSGSRVLEGDNTEGAR
jgi:hypothetical protein